MGKTTLSKKVKDRPVIGTDDYQGMPWELIPQRMLADVSAKPSFVIEGVMVARMLRKAHKLGLPCPVDAVVYLTRPKVQNRKPGQIAMAKGVETVFEQWRLSNQDVPVFAEGARNRRAA